MRSIANLERSFQGEKGEANCIDERTPGGFRLAGLGILLGKEKAAEILSQAGVHRLRSHKGCGAVLEAYRNLSSEEQAKYGNPDNYARVWTEELGQYLGGIPCDQREVEPNDFHPARVIYYDGTGAFDPSTLDELPRGFTITRRYVDGEYAKEVAEFALGIALGEHGYGERVGEGSELILIAVGDPDDPLYSLEELTRELEEIASRYPGKVLVDGFVAPR